MFVKLKSVDVFIFHKTVCDYIVSLGILPNYVVQLVELFACLQQHIPVHMEKHNSKSTIMCEACSKTFTHVNDKVKHFNYRCPWNLNRFIKYKNCNVDIRGAEEGLAAHLHKVHDQTGIFICLLCHRLFAMEKKLDCHNEMCTKKTHK